MATRSKNETRRALAVCLAALEGVNFGLAFASGMTATTAVVWIESPMNPLLDVVDISQFRVTAVRAF